MLKAPPSPAWPVPTTRSPLRIVMVSPKLAVPVTTGVRSLVGAM
ncbi:hypothetical protein AEGHOMDF_5838 [Methylobacterium soli]|nr:hypothetical protein AEGHOMDF_5838 [Methylobacterium soli]